MGNNKSKIKDVASAKSVPCTDVASAKSVPCTDVEYTVMVQIGGKKGTGIFANVNIILYGKDETHTNKYKEHYLFTSIVEDGPCLVSKFSIKSTIDIPEVQKIELWRDNNDGSFANWYLDWIEVTNNKNGLTTIFPAMKWIKENQRYFFKNETSLPQNDPMKELRRLELQVLQEYYQLEVKIPGLPAQIKELPEDETFSSDYFSKCLSTKFVEYGVESIFIDGIETFFDGTGWKNVDEVNALYTVFGKPKSSAEMYFNDDKKFGRQRLSSLNSLIIHLCTAIPANFAVTEDMIKPFLEGKTLKQAIEGKRLFMTNLAILENCPTVSEDLKMTCPLALFYFNEHKHLMPIAIQLYQKKGPTNPVFLPSDSTYTWMLAKLWYNLADSTYHQALTHLNFTHLMMEGISVSTKRNLAFQHPIMKLLSPHFLYLMAIDSLALITLIDKNGIVDKISNAGTKASFYIMRKSMEWWRLDLHGTLPEDLKSRRVLDQSVLTDAYHVRDDGLLLYGAIKTYVENYVMLYYSEEGSLEADYEIQNWGAELVKSRDDGGVGILGVPGNGNFKTTDQLVITLTAIIYTCSASHAAANFPQYDEYGSPFNYPYYLSGVPPKDKKPVEKDTILATIANRDILLQLMSITKILSNKATDSLGYFEKQFIVDPHAVQIVQEFRQKLLEVSETITERNKKREFPYEWLLPKYVPNAISI